MGANHYDSGEISNPKSPDGQFNAMARKVMGRNVDSLDWRYHI